MRKSAIALFALSILATSLIFYGFTSTTAYSYGRPDVEYTECIVCSDTTIKAGQWVTLAYTDTNADGDSGVVVKPAYLENVTPIFGVAVTGGNGAARIKVQTWGVGVAYINGSDSDQTDSSGTAITNGTVLASSIVAGAAGAASTYMTLIPTVNAIGDTYWSAISAANASMTVPCGVALETVPATDTGVYNTYDVFITCR